MGRLTEDDWERTVLNWKDIILQDTGAGGEYNRILNPKEWIETFLAQCPGSRSFAVRFLEKSSDVYQKARPVKDAHGGTWHFIVARRQFRSRDGQDTNGWYLYGRRTPKPAGSGWCILFTNTETCRLRDPGTSFPAPTRDG